MQSSKVYQNLLLTGMTILANYESKKFVFQQNTRSACHTGPFPAFNMLFYTDNICGCFTMIRGEQGYGQAEPIMKIEDSKRLIQTDLRSSLSNQIKLYHLMQVNPLWITKKRYMG